MITIRAVRELHEQGLNDAEIARQLDAAYTSVNKARRVILQLPAVSKLGQNSTINPEDVRSLRAKNLNDREIAQRLGCSISTVYKQRKRMGLPPAGRRVTRKYYTVYRRKTDEILAYGTAKECAQQLGIRLDSFYCTVSRTPNRKKTKYEIFIDLVEEEE